MEAVRRVHFGGHEKDYRQLAYRLGAPLIREVLTAFRLDELSAQEAASRLGVGRTRLYELYAYYLRACAAHRAEQWAPGRSGGDHAAKWPPQVEALLRKLLSVRPPAPYRCAASEVFRRLGYRLDSATVRRWAMNHRLAHPLPPPRVPASLRRWQCLKLGALWQLDSTPHRWFPGDPRNYPLLDMLDDCSRLCTGAKIYQRENLLAYFDFLPAAFIEHGLPLELYVDCHSLFFPQCPETLTQLGAALLFYGISLRYAHSPQAKGKIERQHQYWQGRLPALFAADGILTPEQANALLPDLLRHRNTHEIHREIRCTPTAAARKALREGRSVLRPVPHCPWWPYVWSQRSRIVVGPDGRVPVGTDRLRVNAPPGSRLIHCLHPDLSITILAQEPLKDHRPVVLLKAHTT